MLDSRQEKAFPGRHDAIQFGFWNRRDGGAFGASAGHAGGMEEAVREGRRRVHAVHVHVRVEGRKSRASGGAEGEPMGREEAR